MNDMEEEFQSLVQIMYESIQDKQNAGTITFAEAQELREMVNARLQPPPRAWSSSSCSIGSEDQDDLKDGWVPSMVCY